MIISTQWSLVWGIACVLFAFILAYLLYQKSFFNDSGRIRKGLFFLRFVVVFVLAFFLLKPYITQNKIKKERPIINIGVDNSTSMLANSDSLSIRQDIQQKIINLQETLSEKYQVQVFAFGEKIERTNTFDFSHRKTDIHSFFNELSELYKNRNVAANIIVSDGIYNSSNNPLYSNYSFDAPLFTVLVGDTVQKKDLQIAKVSYNEIAYLGNTFPIEVGVMAQFCKQEKVKVSIHNNGKKIDEKVEVVNQDKELVLFDFKLSAERVGVQKYDVKVDNLQNESNLQNNEQVVFIDILESKEKILLLSDKTHPDIKAISQAVETNENYELTHLSIDEFDGNFTPYSLVIPFHLNLESPSIPSFYFIGQQNSSVLTQWVSTRTSQSINEIEAAYAPFSLFSLNDDWKNWLNQLPPLYSYHSSITFKSLHNDLFYQSIVGLETDRPVFSFSELNDQRTGVCFVEGLWKWRLYEYATNQNHQYFDELINKSIQFLSVKTDQRPLRLKYNNLITENDRFYIQAEFYNSNFELITTSDISLILTDDNGVDFPYTFNKLETTYFLELDNLKNGNYTFIASTIYNGEEVSYKGQFSVKPLDIEKMNTKANHQSLYAISEKYNGKSYSLDEDWQLLSDLEAINGAVVSYFTKSKSDLINLRWISILLFVILSFEWFVRKRITNI